MHKKVVLWNFAYAIKGSAAHIIRKLKKGKNNKNNKTISTNNSSNVQLFLITSSLNLGMKT